jgi:carbon-monoxide dehydrogenase medium subunit
MEPYHKPSTLSEACSLLEETENAEVIAGGQTLMLHIREGLKSPSTLVDVSSIPDLTSITETTDSISIKAAVTYDELGSNPLIEEYFPFLVTDVVPQIAGPQVRSNGTVGGGLCYGDPALDLPPALLVLDAEVTITDGDTSRTVPLSDFFVGYYETDIESNELLTDVTVPKTPPRTASMYKTMAPRQGDYAIAGVAVSITLDDSNECQRARIGLTNAGDTPIRVTDAEAILEGTDIGSAKIENAVDEIENALDLIGDEQVPKSYQETVFRRLSRHCIETTRADIRGERK